jgi:hypothetical protein
MRLRKAGIVTSLIFLFLTAVSVPAYSETEGERQEKLGEAIQQTALLNQQRSAEAGAAQEKLGRAIQETAQASRQATEGHGELQEQLGRQIQDSAVLKYAQGLTQERMGEILVQMARS